MNAETNLLSQARYEELIKNEAKLEILRNIISQDTSSYGFTESTSKAIEAVLGIKRSVEE